MREPIIAQFKFKDQDVRFAFDDDDTYIFIEDAQKLHDNFGDEMLSTILAPEDIITISVKEPNKEPQEHKVVSIFRSRLFSISSHLKDSDTYWEINHWLYGVMGTNSEYKWFKKDNADRYSDPEFREKHLAHAYKMRGYAEQMVLKEQFFIDLMSKAADEEVTYEFLDPEDKTESPLARYGRANQKKASNEAPIA